MHDIIVNLFSSGSFIPHGHCYLWKPGLVWLHLISDAIIGFAYYSIPLTLFYFVRKREDLPFSWIFLLFAAFIISCGTTHIAAIWTLWHPTYWLSGIIKAGTAIVSLLTAIELVPLVPQALALPSPIQLSRANEALHAQIEERLRVENELRRLQDELEERVQARTAELVNVNQQLQQEIDERHRAEAALRISSERLVLAQQVGKMGTCEWNVQTGELIWTEEMEALFGLAPGSFEGSYEYWLKRLHPDDRPGADLAARHTATDGGDFDTEFRIILPDGRMRWVAARAKIFYDDAGKPDRLIGVNMDITARKEVQQELQQTLQTLRTLIQASPLPIVVIEPDMTVKLWNAAAEQLFGWSEAELLGQLLPIVPKEKQEECRQLREAVTKGEVFFCVETYRRKRNGSNVVLSISAAPLYDDRGSVNGILLILQDITEREQAQTALQDSEERLRLALIAANQGLYDLNVQTGDAIVTPEYARMLGYEPEEFQETNAKWRDRLHPDDVAEVYQVYEDYVAGRRDEYRVEFRQRTQSGDWKWILSLGKIVSWDNQGQPIRMLGTHTDISDRKQAEEALRQREQRLDLATSAAKLGVFEWNAEADHAVWENPLMYQIFGHTPEDGALSKDQFINHVIHPDDRESFERCLSESAKPNNLFHAVCRIRRRHDGEWRWIEFSGRFTLTSDGISLCLIGVLGDITDRKQAEAERERLLAREQAAREQAEAANRIKDEFLAVLSHELRSPLNPILGWTKLLRSRKLDEQKTAHALETIERNASLQTQLIGDLLDVSCILQGKLSLNIAPVDLATTITAAMETVHLAAQAKSIQIHTAFNEAIGQVTGDGARLQQIIWNLLTNAVKFTPEGGRVEVRLERVGTQAQITVSDTGKGISPDFLPYVFDYFRQADGATTRKFGGLGLGLAIVRHLVELHGGMVTAQSLGEGQGATFTVRLPLIKECAGLENEPSANGSTDELVTTPLVGLSILVVDDDADTREYLSFLLEQAGATVICTASAYEALQVLVQSTPDILLSDIGMPEMDGYMLMRQVRTMPSNRGGQIPAIALTAYAGEMNQQQAIAAGFQQHISKPVEPEYLIQSITSLSSPKAGLVRNP